MPIVMETLRRVLRAITLNINYIHATMAVRATWIQQCMLGDLASKVLLLCRPHLLYVKCGHILLQKYGFCIGTYTNVGKIMACEVLSGAVVIYAGDPTVAKELHSW